jgi:hypothetical protein
MKNMLLLMYIIYFYRNMFKYDQICETIYIYVYV